MAQRHWLDPLARHLLVATGLIPAAPPQPPSTDDGESAIERDLLSLKLQQNPALRLTSAVEVQHAADLGWRLDVNRATAADWLRLPGITADQVNLLLRLQRGGVQLSGAEDLGQALDLQADKVAGWLPLLDFRWYSEPPSAGAQGARLDLNLATARELGGLGLSGERCQRLVRERAREPFRDLADLQDRLQLPSDLVERWIGKVRFGATQAGAGQAGPALPLSPKKPRHP
jgi:DNA uptake protein ComE-like DNA-binding protein